MKNQIVLISMYLGAIVAANLLVAQYGPSVAVINAFLFIGLDLSSRDYLHEKWHNTHLKRNMFVLIVSGSIISYLLNRNAQTIAIASCLSFMGAATADTLIYSLLHKHSKYVKMNGSNLVSSAVDSILFPALAFGFPLLYLVMLGQFVAKVGGGFVWSLIIIRLK